VAVEQPVDQMQVARPAGPGAHGKPARHVRVGAGCKGGDLLVPGVQPLDAAMPAQRVGEAVEAVADDAVNSAHAGRGQGFDHLVRHGLCHVQCAFLLGEPPRSSGSDKVHLLGGCHEAVAELGVRQADQRRGALRGGQAPETCSVSAWSMGATWPGWIAALAAKPNAAAPAASRARLSASRTSKNGESTGVTPARVQASTKRPARRRKRRAGRRGTQVGGHVGGAQHQPEQPGRRGRGRLHGGQAPGALDQPDQARCPPGVDSQLRVGFVLLGILDLHGTVNKTAAILNGPGLRAQPGITALIEYFNHLKTLDTFLSTRELVSGWALRCGAWC